ncbi:lipopolysaccharide export system protein lptA [Candidatus Photodesmus blepharus]|uniref:Lipopolysaccharide export system protein LptA n=2 Tax=Candidatus Photodesmus blepharonis TaxID=1179155 RepID=A0A084CM46_9GAMM|nr:lipopolysaccharide export system protein lptA [Candidatus Photodesmus blepharus]
MALSVDQNQPVYIDSNSQQLDMQNNQATFLGNVKLKQGSIKINADKVVIIRDMKTGGIQEIKGYGNLATFSQLTDDNKVLYGEAEELCYKTVDDQLTMLRRAMLAQDDSMIRGSKIRYKISKQKLIADGNIGDRVTTVLQLQAIQK